MMKLKFVADGETKGALKFRELNAAGRPVDSISDGKIGQLYMRKSAFPDGKYPEGLVVTVESV